MKKEEKKNFTRWIKDWIFVIIAIIVFVIFVLVGVFREKTHIDAVVFDK